MDLGLLEIVLAVVCLVLTIACSWLGIRLAEQNGRILLRLDALEALVKGNAPTATDNQVKQFGVAAGTLLNDFTLPVLNGGTMSLSQWKGRMLALIFFDPNCPHCRTLLPELRVEFAQIPADGPQPLILTTGGEEANRKLFDEHPVACPVLVQRNSEVARMLSVGATPLALFVDQEGKTAGNALVGGDQILSFFQAAAKKAQKTSEGLPKSRIERNGLKAGTTAPIFHLPTLDGGELSLDQYRGRPVLLVFSDPDCGPCNQLSPKLEQMYRESKEIQILMISRGDPEANRAKVRQFHLTFPVVLQRQWEISREYGMFATPIGYLVDENGVLAADVAVGAEKILDLAAQRQGIVAQAGR